jgi:hypothetical protein
MWCWRKLFKAVSIFFLLEASACQSQQGILEEGKKRYPIKWVTPVRQALSHYPELDSIRICFRERKRITPLSTRPTFRSLFRPHHRRTYLITISSRSIALLEPILFERLSASSQIGVLGHELAHVTDMKRFGFWGFVCHSWRYLFNEKYGDAFEFETDRLCIVHGLGHELKDWSTEVRTRLQTSQFFQQKSKKKKGERYMNPETIQHYLDSTRVNPSSH